MRNNHYFLLLFLFNVIIATCQKEDSGNLSARSAKLLAECPDIESFISQHFPAQTIKRVEPDDTDDDLRIYEVYLSGDVELEFNHLCEVVEIETDEGVPHSALMSNIVAYVQANYPDEGILEWERSSDDQLIELSNDLELVFDLDGNFIRIDD